MATGMASFSFCERRFGDGMGETKVATSCQEKVNFDASTDHIQDAVELGGGGSSTTTKPPEN